MQILAREREQQVLYELLSSGKPEFLTMVTCFGVKDNAYYRQVVDNQITMDALFEKGP